ncbi:protein containing DUF1566 [Beggiatoa sp. PS]|nr:protein containing DUF1566 [Beggiatoa sp. PS]
MKRNLNNPDDKKRLIELLLECPSIRDKETRYAVLGLLPTDIVNAIKTSDSTKVHIIHIVNTCINFSNGINELFEAIAFFDEKTEPFQKLRDFLENNKAEAEKQRQAEIAKPKSEQKSYRYIDNGDGTVTDNRTGLIWLKNANCFGRQNWETAMQSAAQLADGQRGLSDGSKTGDWRLPTIEEWEAMIDKKYSSPVLSNAAGTDKWKEGDAFSGVQADGYWSSTTCASLAVLAWRVDLNGGVTSYGKTGTFYVWPVRGGQ